MSTAVCFDLDGTLVEFAEPYETILDGTSDAHLGHTVPELIETYNDAFYEAFLALEPEPYLAGMRAVREEADIETEVTPGALVATLHEREVATTMVRNDVRPLLDSLVEHHRLGVITNGLAEWQEAKLRRHDLLDTFDAVVASYDAGAHKPDPAPFEAARERLDAETYVMVGDDDADVEGARNAGFVPVHLASDAPDVQVPDLASLGTLLDALR